MVLLGQSSVEVLATDSRFTGFGKVRQAGCEGSLVQENNPSAVSSSFLAGSAEPIRGLGLWSSV